jgi:hypothetical protein
MLKYFFQNSNQLKKKLSELINSHIPQIEKTERLLSTKEVKVIYKVSSVTLWKWRKNGLITGYRIGKLIKYKESEIMDFLTKIHSKK